MAEEREEIEGVLKASFGLIGKARLRRQINIIATETCYVCANLLRRDDV